MLEAHLVVLVWPIEVDYYKVHKIDQHEDHHRSRAEHAKFGIEDRAASVFDSDLGTENIFAQAILTYTFFHYSNLRLII